ncbi:MAG: LytR family transcriptional regulator, partial [Corynebacterium variabile]|nr:LytR family transcriptional regulator [Corynebacterium variabile]
MTQPPRPDDGSDNYARDHLGRVLRDRFGNPVPRRPEARPEDNSTRMYGDAPSPQGPGDQPAPPQYRRDGNQQQGRQPYR